LNGGDGSVDPDTDAGANWELAPTRAQVDDKADQATTYTETEVDGLLDDKADKATTYTETEVDDLIATRTESPDETAITGTATFTNSTNNIALTGIGSIGLEIGDVVQVTGTASNNKLFTVEVITDDDNVVVNQAHAGGTTSKSLVDEIVSATVTLITKGFNAALGVGQGWVNVLGSRSSGVIYTNPTGRTIALSVRITESTQVKYLEIESLRVAGTNADDVGATLHGVVPSQSTYEVDGGYFNIFLELR